MKRFSRDTARRSGILLHLTSLPSPHGIGDLGSGAWAFVDFLSAGAQTIWQFLPLCPTSFAYSHSPYMSPSAFAANPLLISPDALAEMGLLDKAVNQPSTGFSPYQVDFKAVCAHKYRLLGQAFEKARSMTVWGRVEAFSQKASWWLDDYVLFQALKTRYNGAPWYNWPRELARRDAAALASVRSELARAMDYHRFLQWAFQLQWQRLREYAWKKGVRLMGDMPIYVSPDSCDVWANQGCFQLNAKTLMPSRVAGVPPDYFSPTGQRWGNPLYKWREKGRLNMALLKWWRSRFKRLAQLVDIVRIDHFRGLESYWSIPASEKTAVKGRWVKGPGPRFFSSISPVLKELELVAEDLGTVTPEVERLRDSLGMPGMKVLQFAFDSGSDNPYLPHN